MNRQQVLSTLIDYHGWTRGVELGVFEGATFFYLLEHFPHLSMVGIDRWEPTPGPTQDRETGEASYANKPMLQIERAVFERVRCFEPDRANVIKGDTAAVAGVFADASFDFAFIDADHTTAAVLADIAAWRPKIKPGGALTGHDSNWPSVRRAIDQTLFRWEQYEANVWVKFL